MRKRISSDAAKGGRARANVLTPEQRSEIAREAVRARWEKAGKLKSEPKNAIEPEISDQNPHEPGPPDQPHSLLPGKLTLGSVELECHVLNDLRRVFTQREMVRAISDGRESGNLQRYVDRMPLAPQLGEPIKFKIGSQTAFGYEATDLIEICSRYVEARDNEKLGRQQFKLAIQASIILRATAKVGIIALVDEATGFQKMRERNALQLKLQAFIADDLQEWARMFPESFWLELARLENVRYSPRSRPLRWGRYVMMFVYDAVDGDVGKQLRKLNPDPQFLRNHHQWLKKFGREAVSHQITRVVTIMQLCHSMDDFRAKFAHVFKKAPLQMAFDDLGWSLAANAS